MSVAGPAPGQAEPFIPRTREALSQHSCHLELISGLIGRGGKGPGALSAVTLCAASFQAVLCVMVCLSPSGTSRHALCVLCCTSRYQWTLETHVYVCYPNGCSGSGC